MKIPLSANGLLLLCLTTFAACTPVRPSPAPTITVNECAAVTRCTLQATEPETNGELSDALEIVRAAWARCAAVVDMIAACQEKKHGAGGAHE
ncbi:Rz1-like lysis system protein LysC [Burkholderia territorii]|uniref:Rz1-like lysis system protein LysC n=1 Tax=Burkholderia territorii TaxID=1503055 RepID=UPI001E5FD84F|nr:Rz1-like lysis system protein LysC [Burkholderia territorii]